MIIIKVDEVLNIKNKSLYWLAKNTGLSYSTIHNLYHKNTTSISFDTLDKLCDVLNCNTQDIIEYVSKNKPQ